MKSHFQFSKQQRNGILLLIGLIVVLQAVLWWNPFHKSETVEQSEQIETFIREIDALRKVEIENNKPKIYPFNPNYITDYKGYALGMATEEIDRLHKFRATDRWVNSAQEFQKVTLVSDSLLATMAPYFKFPDWVNTTKAKTQKDKPSYLTSKTPKTYGQKIDLNMATQAQLEKVYGVGKKRSERILKYRNKYDGGFVSDIELSEVWGLTDEVITQILQHFTVKTPRPITVIYLNTAGRDQLVTVPYIDYEVAFNIIEERTLRDGFNSLEDLLRVEGFPKEKIEIIKLYLQL
ncbi:MAG: helix-hairpin-helix domain-containing protein [Winogradskyella arenosi]